MCPSVKATDDAVSDYNLSVGLLEVQLLYYD
jgi:hypothetical protein